MDSSQVGARVSKMWERLAKRMEKRAAEALEEGSTSDMVRCAKLAEAFYWRATGEMDCAHLDMKNIS